MAETGRTRKKIRGHQDLKIDENESMQQQEYEVDAWMFRTEFTTSHILFCLNKNNIDQMRKDT